MDVEKMLVMMAAQRHEFINHLQVISGLIQMRQEHRVREYIVKVSQSIKGLSKVAQLKLPHVAAVLLNAYYLAIKTQVTVKYNVQADLAGCDIPDQKVAKLLEEVINQILAGVMPTSSRQSCLHININRADAGGYLCLLSCTGVFQDDKISDSSVFNWAQNELSAYGGALTWQWSREHIEATVFLPVKL